MSGAYGIGIIARCRLLDVLQGRRTRSPGALRLSRCPDVGKEDPAELETIWKLEAGADYPRCSFGRRRYLGTTGMSPSPNHLVIWIDDIPYCRRNTLRNIHRTCARSGMIWISFQALDQRGTPIVLCYQSHIQQAATAPGCNDHHLCAHRDICSSWLASNKPFPQPHPTPSHPIPSHPDYLSLTMPNPRSCRFRIGRLPLRNPIGQRGMRLVAKPCSPNMRRQSLVLEMNKERRSLRPQISSCCHCSPQSRYLKPAITRVAVQMWEFCIAARPRPFCVGRQPGMGKPTPCRMTTSANKLSIAGSSTNGHAYFQMARRAPAALPHTEPWKR